MVIVLSLSESGRYAGRAEDLKAVFGGRLHHQLHVGRRWRTGRELRAGGGLGQRADEAREVAWFGDQEEPRHLGAHDERVRDVARPEDERAGWCDVGLSVDPDRELTFEDVEPLVLVVVDVERRAASAWRRLLCDHGAGAARPDR